jgi:hypothetical protein
MFLFRLPSQQTPQRRLVLAMAVHGWKRTRSPDAIECQLARQGSNGVRACLEAPSRILARARQDDAGAGRLSR